MKHIKSYENIFTNVFKKCKKLPTEITKFGNMLAKFVSKNINDEYGAFYDITEYNTDNMPISSIMIDTHDIFIPFRFISLYYNDITELMMLSFISKDDFLELKEYLISILDNEKYKQHLKNNEPSEIYFIEKDKIKELMVDINQTDYDLFLSTKKYNL